MNAPAIPPADAPMNARSRTVRFFRRIWGIRLGRVGSEIVAKGGEWWVRVRVVKWLMRELKSVRVVESWLGFGDGKPSEDEILASIEEDIRVCVVGGETRRRENYNLIVSFFPTFITQKNKLNNNINK